MNPREEQEAFIKILMYLAGVDGEISEQEISYYEKTAKQIGLTEKTVQQLYEQVATESVSIEELTEQIVHNETKERLVRELLKLCYADREYTLVEKNGMRDICILMDYSLLRLREQEEEIENIINEDAPEEADKIDIKRVANVLAKVGRKASKLAISKVAEGGEELAHAVANGIGDVGSKISASMATAKKVREENQVLREELGKMTLSETVKQKIIMQLNEKISSLKRQLEEERIRNQRNEEMICLLEAQIEDLAATIEAAENAKVA